jgi:hypothetical protein
MSPTLQLCSPGTVDTINAVITVTQERQDAFEFSNPLYLASYSAIYKIPQDSTINFASITAKIDLMVYVVFIVLFAIMILVFGIAQM